jgi:hypothetical protein
MYVFMYVCLCMYVYNVSTNTTKAKQCKLIRNQIAVNLTELILAKPMLRMTQQRVSKGICCNNGLLADTVLSICGVY